MKKWEKVEKMFRIWGELFAKRKVNLLGRRVGEKKSFEEEVEKRRQCLLWRAGRLLVSLSVFWKLFST